ncbi:MAG: hypothetical protein J0I21_10820 [Alphaproteobacteria bacterium]|nr:hypothetical protein [Alphaproteobacteria bacterium]
MHRNVRAVRIVALALAAPAGVALAHATPATDAATDPGAFISVPHDDGLSSLDLVEARLAVEHAEAVAEPLENAAIAAERRVAEAEQQYRQGRATRAAVLARRAAASDADSAARSAAATLHVARQRLDQVLGAHR